MEEKNLPSQNNIENLESSALTSIRDMYTLSPTQEDSEADRIMIQNFISTLAEIALSIAARKNGGPRG
jgi:hypothetical protein